MGLLHAQVPISTNPILPTPGESGLLMETVQIRITIDPEPRNVERAMEVRQWQSEPDKVSPGSVPGLQIKGFAWTSSEYFWYHCVMCGPRAASICPANQL